MACKVKKGDTVYVMTGSYRGSKGQVMKNDPTTHKVLVEGVNLRTHHVKPSVKNPEGGRIKKEHWIHVSNVALVDPKADTSLAWTERLATRVGFRFNEQGKKERFAKRSGEALP